MDEDLEAFKLFARAKLNLGEETVYNYVQRVKAFLRDRVAITDKDVQAYINKKKEYCVADYVSNIISSFKAYFRDYKGLPFMNGYKHPSSPLKMKEEIEPEKVEKFIEAIDDLGVKCVALFLAASGLRRGEVLSLKKSDVDRNLKCITPNCHSGQTKHSGVTYYNKEVESCLLEYEQKQTQREKESDRLLPVRYERFFYGWKRAKEISGVYLKPKDLRDFFSQEMGKALIPDRYIDVFQGRAPKSVLAEHHTLKE